jgi:transcriptional regulator with XRE-family HTH domain
MTEIPYNNWETMTDKALILQIGLFAKHHRIVQNRTQADLAMSAGISRSTLSLLEKGETVSIATLLQVLRVLNQLHVMNSFVIPQTISPLLLAKMEKEKRQRVRHK